MKTFITSLFLMCFSMIVFGQNTVSGTVSDAFGDPLIGVNVSEKGTTNGTVTDINGNYTLDVSSLPADIVFSQIGEKGRR